MTQGSPGGCKGCDSTGRDEAGVSSRARVRERELKLLLVCPAPREFRTVERGQRPPRRMKIFRFSMLSPLRVAAAAPEGVETTIVDEHVEPVDFSADADMVGISFMTYNAPRAYEIAREFRRRGKTVIFGGYHPTLAPGEAAEHCDAVCVGEAEANLPQMMEDFKSGRLARFYSKRSERLRLRPVPLNLIDKRKYIVSSVVQATRGCPNRCDFCSVSAFHRGCFQSLPVEDVVAEVSAIRERTILFMDDNLIADMAHARSLLKALVPLGKRWYTQVGVKAAQDPEFLALLRKSGCRGVFVGFESISQPSLEGVHKSFHHAASYEEAVRRFHAHGIAVYAAFVLGFDQDRPETFQETARFLKRARVDALQLTVLTPFPGTPLFEKLDREGRIFDRDWEHYDMGHVVFQPEHMSAEELKAGHDGILAEFYSWPAILRRLLWQVRYLSPQEIAAAFLLGAGYRYKLSKLAAAAAESGTCEAKGHSGSLTAGTQRPPPAPSRRPLTRSSSSSLPSPSKTSASL
jgi:radical SAM superfamily enzyme YgiQ (UPF0313 family)